MLHHSFPDARLFLKFSLSPMPQSNKQGSWSYPKRTEQEQNTPFTHLNCRAHLRLRQTVSLRAQIIPEKVKNSRPINGVKKSEMNLFWCISITSNVKACKKFNERAQTANFSYLSRLRQELYAENPKNMENKGNLNVN